MNNGTYFSPPDASSIAHSTDTLFWSLVIFTAIISGGIASLIVLFVVKYRRQHARQIGVDTGSHMWMEWTWTIIPLILAIGIFFWSAVQFIHLSLPKPSALQITVVGKQWMWKISHESGREEINELHIPLGRPVHLTMTSQDVIHSFFIPAFRMKQDVLPGRYSQESFTPTELGEFHLFCSEYCGTGHAQMGGRVVVMTPSDYEAWTQKADLDARPDIAGSHLFSQYGCINCHAAQAPSLAGIYGKNQLLTNGQTIRVDEDYLRESILSPRAKIVAGYSPIMPSYTGQLSEEQIYQLIAYIKSLAPLTTATQEAPK